MNFNQYKIPEGSLESRIRKNVTSRQKLKKKWDKHCKYGAEATPDAMEGAAFAVENFKADESENWVRLLDEGVVVEGDGTPYAVIAKGTIKQWFEDLPANFKGYINKDHISGIGLGNYAKSDLRLVEIGDGRYGVDVNVKLDHELYAVKDLLRQMDRKALSSEFYYDADEYVKASVVTGDKNYPDWWLIPKISAVAIVGYAVVDNPKNANSYDPNLLEKAAAESGERNSMNLEELRKLAAQGDAAAIEELKKLEAANEGDEDDKGTDGEGENTEGDAENKANANAEGTEGGEGEGEGEGDAGKEGEGEGDKEADGDAEGDEGDKEGEGEGENFSADALVEQVKTLKADFEAVQAENKELKAQLAAQKTAKADLATRLSEVLGLASAAGEGENEGAATPSKKEDEEDEYTASIRKSLSEL